MVPKSKLLLPISYRVSPDYNAIIGGQFEDKVDTKDENILGKLLETKKESHSPADDDVF